MFRSTTRKPPTITIPASIAPRVLRVTTGQVKTGEAADWVAAALRGLPEERGR